MLFAKTQKFNFTHPRWLNRIVTFVNHNHLFVGQLYQPVANLNVAIVHKVSDTRGGSSHWQIMDYLFIKRGSLLKFLGTGKQFRVSGDLLPTHLLFELVDVSTDRQIGVGDIIALTERDRKLVTPAAPVSASDAKLPSYFTADDE